MGVWGQDDGAWDRFLWFNNGTHGNINWGPIGSGLSDGTTGLAVIDNFDGDFSDPANQGLMLTESYYDEDQTNGSGFYLNGKLRKQFTANNSNLL